MEAAQRAKISQFLKDEAMQDAVKTVIHKSFLKHSKSKELHYLAAGRIAIDLLEEAWIDLANNRFVSPETSQPTANIAL